MGTRGVLLAIVAACGGGGTPGVDTGAAGDSPPGTGPTLSDTYPGDVGLGGDPAVVWFEDFEEGSVAAVVARYDQAQGQERMAIDSDHAGGAAALSLTAGGAVSAVDLFKQLPDHDELFVRWYAKYQASVPWHHSGVWFGGYNPGMAFPSPNAGEKPNGDDRFSISIEPVYDSGAANPRFDYYNYWMAMHSWMEVPTNDGTSYYGNALVHHNNFTVDSGQWVCVEVHAKLNPDAGSGAGAVLEVWKNDAPVSSYTDAGPTGYWIRDKFCTADADASECTDFPAPTTDHLDLQMRSTTAYGINALWPQNYITDPAMGTLMFDQMVVATKRVGCIR